MEEHKATAVKTRQQLSKLIGTANKTAIKASEVSEFEQPLRQIALRQDETYTTLPADAMKKMKDTVRQVTWVEPEK